MCESSVISRMYGYRIGLGVGTAVTTFLIAGAATIELLGAGEAPGIGIVGVFVGLVVGLLAGVGVGVYAPRVSGRAVRALVAYATFGIAFVVIAGARYVNVPGADGVFVFPVHVGVSVVIAVSVALLTDRGGPRNGS